MKRKFIYVLTAFFMLFATSFFAKVKAAEPIGKIVFHYQLWNQDYSSAGLWCWNTGDGGSQAPIKSDVTDSFGAVYEVLLCEGASDVGIIACRKDIDLDSRWDYRETPDGENFTVDVTPITSGEVTEMHIYYFQGGYQTYYVANPSKVNIFVAYFDPTNSYEANLGLHAWGNYTDEKLLDVAWGTPAKVFSNGFKSPADVAGKIALLSIDETDIGGAGFLIYAGADDSKKTSENACNAITDWASLKNGDVKLLYVTGGKTYYGDTATASFVEDAFKFDFVDYNETEVSGTYAVNPTTIFAKTTQALTTKEVVGQTEVTKTKYVSVPKLKEGGTPYLQTDKTFTPFTSLPALENGSIGRVVLHYQNWNGDYTGYGTWSWGRGGSYTSGTAMLGVDDFGAVIDLQIASDASDTIGLIAMKGNLTADTNDWPGDVKDSGDLNVNVEAIKDQTVEVIHVYYFAGGNTLFVADPAKANVLVAYYDLTGTYEETLGFHAWGSWTNFSTDMAWGTPAQLFVDGFVSPKGVTGKVAMLQVAPADAAGVGFLIYAGADDSKKTADNASNAIAGLATMQAGDVTVLYVSLGSAYDGVSKKADFAEASFSGEIEWVEEPQEYKEMVDVLGTIDFKKFFKVMQGTEEVAIEAINFNKTAETTNEFVIILAEANKLDSTKEYTLIYNNGLEGNDAKVAEAPIAMDTEAPVITLISEDDDLKIVQGSKFDLFPLYRVTDDRDSNLQNRVYVKVGQGTLNTGVAGEYPITLVVEDTWGNVGELTFNFTVVAPQEAAASCQKASASIAVLGLFGLVVVFFRKRRLA